MSYAVGTPGPVNAVNAAANTANLPASVPLGSLLLLFAAARTIGTTTLTQPSGYSTIASTVSAALYGKIAGASETVPTVGLSGADTSETQMVALTGGPASITAITDGSPTIVSTGTPPTGLIPHGALAVALNNDIVIEMVAQRATNWSSMGLLAGFSLIGDNPTGVGTVMSMGWQYQIQTTATSIASGNVVITGGSGNAALSILVALKSGTQPTLPLPRRRRLLIDTYYPR